MTPSTSRSLLRRHVTIRMVSVFLSVTLATAFAAPNLARAVPLNTDPAAGAETTLPWSTLGLPNEITLFGTNTNRDFTIPVSPGLTVTRLRGLIHAPVDFGAGFVEIDDSTGRFLATVDMPAVTPDQVVVPFDVDISPAQVSSSGLGLSFTVRETGVPAQGRCGLGEQLVLSNLAAVFVGNEPAPTTVAGFFPPIFQRLTIYAPFDADSAETQAVFTLASAVARNYGSQSTAIAVVRQLRGAAPPPAAQFTRAVVVERGDAGLSVVNADRANVYLKLSGRGDQLSDQASLLVNGLLSLVQDASARVDKSGSSGVPDADVMSFRQLNLSGESSVLRTSKLTVGVDRSALGARTDDVQVHLLATYTPVASSDSASLMVSVNGHAVYTSALDTSGRVDAVFDVPDEFLQQRIAFAFELTFSPRQLCSPTIAPVTFQLDPRSTLTMRRGGPPLGGFSAVPSEFSPEFLVGLDGSSPSQLDYAARVIADIARQSGTALMPRVVDVKDAAAASTGALIVANSATLALTSLSPPIGGERSNVQIGLPNELRADIERGIGSIQVFADQPRRRTVVLVTTSGTWSLVDPVFAYLDQLPNGWSSLTGDVLAAGAEGKATNLSIESDDIAATAPEPSGWKTWLAIGAGCVALGALALTAALWWRRRRGDAAQD